MVQLPLLFLQGLLSVSKMSGLMWTASDTKYLLHVLMRYSRVSSTYIFLQMNLMGILVLKSLQNSDFRYFCMDAQRLRANKEGNEGTLFSEN